MSLPIYSGIRTADGSPAVFVTRNGERQPLTHLLRHSPDGFEWGYDGSGPHDLARSIVGDYMRTDQPAEAYVQALVAHQIAHQHRKGWTLIPADLHSAFRHAAVLPGTPVPLGRVVVARVVDAQLLRHPDGQAFVELCLIRHERGDWGVLDEHDTAANATALRTGARLLSNYPIPDHICADGLKDDTRVWVITEAADDDGHRAATTVLYPCNY